jgi:hypothetical protein
MLLALDHLVKEFLRRPTNHTKRASEYVTDNTIMTERDNAIETHERSQTPFRGHLQEILVSGER